MISWKNRMLHRLQQMACTQDSCLQNGCINAWETFGWEICRDLVRRSPRKGMAMLLEENAVKQAIPVEPLTPQQSYETLPLRMACDVRDNRMAHVGEITRQILAVGRFAWEEHPQDAAWYILTVADCVELVDEQLYEHYRALVDELRRASGWIKTDSGRFYDLLLKEASVYAMVKGIRMGVLHEEKYVDIAKTLHAWDADADETVLGLQLLIYSEGVKCGIWQEV